jgi:hypothetical protein
MPDFALFHRRAMPVAALLSLLIFTVAGAGAPPARVAVQIDVAATPAEQLRRCNELLARARQEQDSNRRIEQVLTAMANLDVIQRRWPKATEAITQAVLTAADAALEFDMPRNAVDLLAGAPKETTDPLGMELRMGRAYDVLQDDRAAEQHLLAAKKLIEKKTGHRSDADTALQMLASMYLRDGRTREAVKTFQAAAELPGQPPVRAATLSLSALKAAVQLNDDVSRLEARNAAEAVDRHLRRGRGGAQNDAVSAALAAVERDLARVKAEYGL